uniref:CASP8-associated protein 2 n=1 Tax=Nothoprocta perdicaria TaxID=30464 RepID=A0A8C6ZR23_NOTPE
DDESSVDIYDGLDNGLTNSAPSSTPTGNSLNLFDEILIEEGTAKEASYNELRAEYGKCQQQIKELMKKFKEIQAQNVILQNENQALKKNISALIKTARVEINRKDEEISNLHQRYSWTVAFYTFLFVCKSKEPKFRSPDVGDSVKMDHRTKNDSPKDAYHNYSSHNMDNGKCSSDKRSNPYLLRYPPEELCTDGAHKRLPNYDHCSNKDNRKERKEMKSDEQYSRGNDSKNRRETQQSYTGSNIDSQDSDPHQKLQTLSEKASKNELQQKSQSTKLKCSPSAERRAERGASSWEKQATSKDRFQTRGELYADERSQNMTKKDVKMHDKEEKGSGQKSKPNEKQQEQSRRSGRVSSPHSKNEHSKNLHESRKCRVEESRKARDSDYKRERGTNDHTAREGRSSPSNSSSREHKHARSKENSSRHEWETAHSKSERHRTEEKRKRERESQDENRHSRNERKVTKETSHQSSKDCKKGADVTKGERNKSHKPEEASRVADSLKDHKAPKSKDDLTEAKSKDLKLSFMEKLNLTLSPAKKQCLSPMDGFEMSSQKATDDGSTELAMQAEVPEALAAVAAGDVSPGALPEAAEAQVQPQALMGTAEVPTPGEVQAGTPAATAEAPDVVESEASAAAVAAVDLDQAEDDDHLAAENVECSVEKTNVCKDTPQSPERTVLSAREAPVVDQNACDLEPDLPEITTTASCLSGETYPRTKERETNPIPADDDSSILSIDLNHLRYIPKAISPLNSPMRPLAKALRMESPGKGLVKSYNKDIIPESTVGVCPSKNLSKEVNKENQKPVSMSGEHLEMESQLSISSDEIEEGEIISSDDEEEKSKPERTSENTKKSMPRTSPETRNLTSNPHNQKSKTVCGNEDSGKFVSVKLSTKKNRERHKNQTFSSSKEMKKNKTVSLACLEKMVQIIAEPSTVQEVMQMLRAIRKQVRKNYMKFKVHFPVQHFHRIIESAIINFTSLIKYLNFSKMSTLGETLKLNLCDTIESKLKQIKKNAIVDRLFEQQVSDMKKQLWKFVDEQLDYLFEKVRRTLIKLCDAVNMGNDAEEGKFERAGKQKHRIGHKNDVQRSQKKSLNARSQKTEEYILSKPAVDYQPPKKCHHEKNKTDAPKTVFTKCLNSIDNTRISQTKVQPPRENNLQGALTPLKSTRHEKEGFQLAKDANKSDLSYDLLTEQQASSLTFNLVSDAQMGEIFKSLLQGSDLLEKSGSNIDRHEWEFRTPEKQLLESQKCRSSSAVLIQEIAPKEASVEPRPIEDIHWPLVSPIRAPSLSSRLQMSIDPNVLDESCMFEVPTSAASCKEDECSLQKTKSFVSSILLEDLAVSLTIPSPLKSDAHLSFLKPENTSGSTPEGVLSAHYSEDALLEEEDATEQDIHLALESDNSSSRSSCSSSWPSRPAVAGFQCRPSLPMQAVIMEKSNDHFIVKIRRAVPCAAPEHVGLVREARASSARGERGGEKRESPRTAAAPGPGAATPGPRQPAELPHGPAGQEQGARPARESPEGAGEDEAAALLRPPRKPADTNSPGTESPSEDGESSRMREFKVPGNVNEIAVGSTAAFPVGCGVESYIDLTGDIVDENSCLAGQSPADSRSQETPTGNAEIGDKKDELEECSVDAFIDLTEELSNETVAGEGNLEIKPTSNTDAGCQINTDEKTSKKRKKDSVVLDNCNSKRQRKESESLGEGNDGNDAKSEGINSVPRRSSSKKHELPQSKDSSPSASSASSPSLYAKNIVKKKGEVVVSWTRNDDREILLECQRKGPSSKTFVSLATRLNKSPNQVSERFKQLMKLFKKSKCK